MGFMLFSVNEFMVITLLIFCPFYACESARNFPPREKRPFSRKRAIFTSENAKNALFWPKLEGFGGYANRVAGRVFANWAQAAREVGFRSGNVTIVCHAKPETRSDSPLGP